MKPEMLIAILLALAVASAITAWISARRFLRHVEGRTAAGVRCDLGRGYGFGVRFRGRLDVVGVCVGPLLI
jgi:hypothetical protein